MSYIILIPMSDSYHEHVITSMSKSLLEATDDFRCSNRLPTGSDAHSSPDRVEAGGSEGEAREASLNELAHRYRPGDRAIFHSPATLPQFDGPYLVERLLPISDAGPQYQIKSVRDGHERAASERELAPVMPSGSLKPWRRAKATSHQS